MTKSESHQHNGEADLSPQIDEDGLWPALGEDGEPQPVKGRAGIRRRDAYDVDFS